VPADDQVSMDGFTRMRAALADPSLRQRAIDRYVARVSDASKPEMADQLRVSAGLALALFSGAERAGVAPKSAGGWQAVAEFMETKFNESNAPATERERTSMVLVRMLNDALFEVLNLSREQAGLAALPADEASQKFLTQAALAISDAYFYPAPVAMMLTDFTQVQASVFQVARAPGKNIVYLGCVLLIVGVFAMLYVRERRLWVWLAPGTDGATQGTAATMALSVNRKSMDTGREFERLRGKLLGTQRDNES
jgi:cytochrome c biogenesis protein